MSGNGPSVQAPSGKASAPRRQMQPSEQGKDSTRALDRNGAPVSGALQGKSGSLISSGLRQGRTSQLGTAGLMAPAEETLTDHFTVPGGSCVPG